MIIINCKQGTDEWLQARAGCITASKFQTAISKVGVLNEQQQLYVHAIIAGKSESEAMEIAGYKAKPKSEAITKALKGEKVGEFSDQSKNYALQVAMERIYGFPYDDGYQTWQSKRGNELEPIARMEHQAKANVAVVEVGFVKSDDGVFGASADGFIEDDEGAEYKCFLSLDKLRAIYFNGDISDVIAQAQGCMWLTGRKRWHVCVYNPALKPIGKQLWMKIVDRDDNYIEKMEASLLEFAKIVDEFEYMLREGKTITLCK